MNIQKWFLQRFLETYLDKEGNIMESPNFTPGSLRLFSPDLYFLKKKETEAKQVKLLAPDDIVPYWQ